MTRSLGLLLLLGGCAALRPPEQLDTMRLAPQFPAAAAPARAGAVQVAPVAADGAIAERRYAYVAAPDPLVLRQAATLFWDVPPAVTIGRALSDALRTRFAGMDGGVVIGRLAPRLLRFEEVTGDASARAVVAVEASFVGAGGAAPGSTARYCQATPIAGSGSGHRAAAFQDSVTAVALAIAGDVAAGRLVGTSC